MAVTTIPTAGIADGAVDTNQLADNAVTIAKATGFGKIAQVVQTIDKDQGSFTLATDTLQTWMTVNITPTSTSSKILIHFDAVFGNQTTNKAKPYVVLRRDGSDIYRANTAGSRKNATNAVNSQDGQEVENLSNTFLDSPSSTSQVSYTLNVAGYNSYTFYKNIPDANGSDYATSCSNITVMEILA